MDSQAKVIAQRYKIDQKIGQGTMSTVYKANDTKQNNAVVALKLLDTAIDDELKLEVFKRETKALTRLEHSNIVKVFEHGFSNEANCYYIVFEYIAQTLQDIIKKRKNNEDYTWCWPIMRQLADALVYAHTEGVIHRDIKPSNILIDETGWAKLTDFGISKLKYELATGVTVSGYHSPGYAAPEQTIGEANQQSDIYSLGCVFYHMLSGKIPPREGISNTLVDSLDSNIPSQIKKILKEMLASKLEERFENAVILKRRLEVTKNYDDISDIYFSVTRNAQTRLFDMGLIKRTDVNSAIEYLLEELGENNPKSVHISLEIKNGDLRVLTDNLRLICAKDQNLPILVIKDIQDSYQPKLEQQKSYTKSFRYLWQVISNTEVGKLDLNKQNNLASTLEDLFSQLATYNRIQDVNRIRKTERKNFVANWETVLDVQKKQLESSPRLYYKKFIKNIDTITFILGSPAPDNLTWEESAPISIIDEDRYTGNIFVGFLMNIVGNEIQISLESSIDTDKIPGIGHITVFHREKMALLLRQRYAISSLLAGATSNPQLCDVLHNLSLASFDEINQNLEFYHTDLADDKKRAVRQALAARDIFLLQGPPGTGKTTTLAEIILQILKIKPEARILISSQSNVAVDHILFSVNQLRTGKPLEIVRIVRPDKISQAAEEWTLEGRLKSWRNEVLERTDVVIKDLKAQTRQTKKQKKVGQFLSQYQVEDLEQCKELLEDLATEIKELDKQKKEKDQITIYIRSAKLGEDLTETYKLTLQEHEEHILKKTESIKTTLELVHSHLPEAIQYDSTISLLEERDRLYKIIVNLLSIDESQDVESRESKLLKLVRNWRKIFGSTELPEFAIPIFERANILAATCLIAGGRHLKDQTYDWAIVDEAGRATAPELLVPLVRARRSIIVGDERQLPPMLDEDLPIAELEQKGITKQNLIESLFATLIKQVQDQNLPVVQMLTVQHRMHPAIGRLISHVFYDGKLEHGVNPLNREHGLDWLPNSVVWYSTTSLPNHLETEHMQSYYNQSEITAIIDILNLMEKSYRATGATKTVAVITPYNAQIKELQEQLTPTKSLKIEIATVDAFQGRDCDVVLYSTVRSNKTRNLGFLKDRRRLNVALSRARQLLIIVGDILTLENGKAGIDGNPYQELVKYMRNHPEDCLIKNLEANFNG